MDRQTFVNLPVRDIDRSRKFFEQLGFSFDPAFSNAGCACMVMSESACVMLLAEGFFQTLTTKPLVEASDATEVVIAVSAGSRDGVDAMLATAAEAGGVVVREGRDHGHMYGGAFEDLDHHLWEVYHMDAR